MQVKWIGGAVMVHGIVRQPGQTYDFNDATANDLIGRGFAKRAAAPKATAPKATAAPTSAKEE